MNKKINLINMIQKKLKYVNSNENDNNELHCQKIIFFVFGLFYKKFKKDLLSNLDFRAWKYGIVELNCRKYFKTHDREWLNYYNCEITNEQYIYLDKIVDIFCHQSPWSLVELSHISFAWYANYEVNDSKIEIKDIYNSFDNFLIN